jgi:hypothetical protein
MVSVMTVRDHAGDVKAVFDSPLEQPIVTYGRMMKPVWLRLQRRQSLILAQFSSHGSAWKDAGQTPGFKAGLLGIIVSSGIVDVDTAVRFDSIAVSTR